MKRVTVMVFLGVLIIAASVCNAVPPAYEGPFGNPEEPALRVVKWPWLGFRKMVMHTHDGLRCGIERHPPAALWEGVDGAACGSCVLLDHTGRGLIYSKLPPKGPLRPGPSYEERAQKFIDYELYGAKESEDLNSQVPNPPVVAAASPPSVAPPPEGGPYLTPKVKEPVVFDAQRRYVKERTIQRDRALARRNNLLRYAR